MAISAPRERGEDRYQQYLSNRHAQLRAGRPAEHPYLPSEAVDRQHEAAGLLVDRITRTREATVVSYQPYIDHVRGAEQTYAIGSEYASVVMGGEEAWFEIVRPATDAQIRTIDFVAAPRLDFILGNTDSPAAERFAQAIDRPQPGHAIVRLVEQAEEPLPNSGYTRMTDSKRMQAACEQLLDHVKKGQPRPIRRTQGIDAHIPTVGELSIFAEREQTFIPLFEASNGVTIGEGRAIFAHLHREDGEATQLFLYPTRAEDGTTATLMSTYPLDRDNLALIPTKAQGRIDWFCGCEKHGTKAEGHSCAHELLGALQAATAPGQEDTLTIIAWGGQDAKGKGSLSHSLKGGNLERLADTAHASGIYRRRIRVPDYLAQLPYEEMRPFNHLAEAFGAALEAYGVTDIDVETGNAGKKGAIGLVIERLQDAGQPISLRFVDGADTHVPDHIKQRDVTTRRQADPVTYAN